MGGVRRQLEVALAANATCLVLTAPVVNFAVNIHYFSEFPEVFGSDLLLCINLAEYRTLFYIGLFLYPYFLRQHSDVKLQLITA